MDDRLVILEEKLAYQERTIADLDDVLRGFTRRVEDLEKVVRALRLQLSDMHVGSPGNEKPPHY